MTMAQRHFDLIVIGSGAAGSSCWYAARQAGKSVAVFEDGTLGGECANFACVPTKALLHCAEVYETVRGAARFGVETGPVRLNYAAIRAWKDAVVSQTGAALGEKPYRDAGVELVRHRARFVGPREVEAGGERYTADKLLVATGSSQSVPDVPGLEGGFLTFKEAIDLEALPRSLLILGGGPVGCEFAQFFSAFGVPVTLADHNLRLLPHEDAEVGDFLAGHFEARGVTLRLGAELKRIESANGARQATIETAGRSETLAVEAVLVATGKAPGLDLGLDAAGVKVDRGGIVVDGTLRSSNPDVYAAGDVTGPYRFTHSASYQGKLAFANMFGSARTEADYRAMPRCVFTSPEVATAGLTEAEARSRGLAVRTGFASMEDNDRGLTTGQREGFVKVVVGADGRLLGGAVVAARAGEVAQELALAISLGATARQVADTIHAFPTFSEALAAACAEV